MLMLGAGFFMGIFFATYSVVVRFENLILVWAKEKNSVVMIPRKPETRKALFNSFPRLFRKRDSATTL